MALYHFDIIGTASIIDEDGELVADDALARSAAVKILAEILPSRILDLEDGGAVRIVVRQGERIVHAVEARSVPAS